MKRCLSCNSIFSSSFVSCLTCENKPSLIDGFYAYAPELAHGGGGFKSHYFSELSQLEEANFWFRSRNDLIIWMLKKYCPNFKSFLEIGCGTGYVLSGIEKAFSNASLHGSEIFTAGLGFAAKRIVAAHLMQMDARSIPFSQEFDVIGAFDVLEHIEEDELVLSQIHAALKMDGYIILTVPQHAWLWSGTDVHACHVRRYHGKDLHRKIKAAGFEIIRSTSFVTFLLPAMMTSRLFKIKTKDNAFDAKAELKIAPWLNRLFHQVLRTELALIKSGWNFPLGGSRFVIAKKC